MATLLSLAKPLKVCMISMGSNLRHAAVVAMETSVTAPGNPWAMVTSFRSLTKVEVSDYLCHFFDFSSCEGELASNIELVTGMRGWGWHARLLRGALFGCRNHVIT